MKRRSVFDTNIAVSALLFRGRTRWLRGHWGGAAWQPMASAGTLAEFAAVLTKRKFRLPPEVQMRLVAEYRDQCEIAEVNESCPLLTRDPDDQKFLDLAQGAGAEVLVTGDDDLLTLSGQAAFAIEDPEAFRLRVTGAQAPAP